jgi:hypothetical protein
LSEVAPHFGRYLLDHNRSAVTNVLTASEPQSTSAIPTLELRMAKRDLDALNSSILEYGLGDHERKPRVEGMLRIDDRYIGVDVSYRGTNNWHHKRWKPSLRIRTDGNRLVSGFRNHPLIAPEDATALRNWLSVEVARQLGMLTNDEHAVRLFVNGHYYGLYTRTWRYDESLLIDQDRLPGPFFRYEHLMGPVFKRKDLMQLPPLDRWEIAGVEPDEGKRILAIAFATAQRSTSGGNIDAINDVFDSEAMARWLAVAAHSATVHVGSHNVAFWLDTTSGKLVPIPHDLNGYGMFGDKYSDQTLLTYHTPHHYQWLLHPGNLALYTEVLYDLLKGPGSAEATIATVREQWQRIRPDAMADVNTSMVNTYDPTTGLEQRRYVAVTELDVDVDQLCGFIAARCTFLLRQLRSNQVIIESKKDDTFTVLVVGPSGAIAAREPVADESVSERELLTSYEPIDFSKPITAIRAYARHVLPGKPEDYTFRNRLGGERIVPTPGPARGYERPGIDPSAMRPPDLTPRRLGPGKMLVRGTLSTNPGQPLTIAAGTTLLMAPGVSLHAHGKVLINGTKVAPVSILPAEEGKAWGVFSITGPATAGSRINGLVLAGGSVASNYNQRFSGSFSVRDCPDIVVTDCRFSANTVGDDCVHLVRSQVTITGCRFERALADAVDLDKCDGVVSDCVFDFSGNDGLDVSMGDVKVADCVFNNSGDKGISAGEGSTVTVTGCKLSGALIGIAAKDRSQVSITGSSFANCDKAVAAYRKKWRWGLGGTVRLLDNVTFNGSHTADVWLDNLSTLTGDAPEMRIVRSTENVGSPPAEWRPPDHAN